MVFVHETSDRLTSLVKKMDQRLGTAGDHPRTLGTYVLFDQKTDELDQQLRALAEKEKLNRVALGTGVSPDIFETYGVAPDAEITVVIYNPDRRFEQKVQANFALRKGELDELRADAIVKALSDALPRKPVVDADGHGEGITLNIPKKMAWQDGPPSLPKGAKIAVLEGDPSKEGPFVFRLKVPDGYRIPPHTHPNVERVTVIAGTFNIGMGETFDEKATQAMPAGGYGFWEPGMKHFVWAQGETIAQFHGTGPWTINYVNPADDPRNQAKE